MRRRILNQSLSTKANNSVVPLKSRNTAIIGSISECEAGEIWYTKSEFKYVNIKTRSLTYGGRISIHHTHTYSLSDLVEEDCDLNELCENEIYERDI